MIGLLSSLAFITVFIAVAIIITIVSLEREKEGFASGVVSLILGLLLWNYSRDIWAFVSTNLATTVYFAIGYVILGIGWSFLKWNEKVKKVFTNFKLIKSKFIKDKGEITSEKLKDFTDRLYESYKFKDAGGHRINFYKTDTSETITKKIMPLGLDNKSLIMSWISYWPLSLLGTLLNNPFRRFFSWVYNKVSGFYDLIGNKHQEEAFGGLTVEAKSEPKLLTENNKK